MKRTENHKALVTKHGETVNNVPCVAYGEPLFHYVGDNILFINNENDKKKLKDYLKKRKSFAVIKREDFFHAKRNKK